MNINLLMARLKDFENNDAIIYKNKTYLYKDILELITLWTKRLENNNITQGSVVAVSGDYSPESISLIIALILNKNIIVPLSPGLGKSGHNYLDIANVQHIIKPFSRGCHIISKNNIAPGNELLKSLVDQQRPGLVLFTSGSSGKPKAVLHDFDKLLSKYTNANKNYMTLCFLMFDHIAGIDTYFYCLYSGGTAVLPTSRKPKDICLQIEKFKVEVLPTSPTFLNLLLISEAYKNYDLSSLKIVTFGSEKMAKSLLDRLEHLFPNTRFVQKYGTTELGSPPSKTLKGDSTWIKMNSEHFKLKVCDGILYVKTDSAMLGYLNAPSPYTKDGWFNTGDAVEVNGEYIKILGRKSEIINVGGEKVYPAEVESIIQELDYVEDVLVFGEKNPITGNIVCADVKLVCEDNSDDYSVKIKNHCRNKLINYAVPVKIFLSQKKLYNDRFKKRDYPKSDEYVIFFKILIKNLRM